MKKNYKTKRGLRLLITLMLMATLLLGCSSTEAETETETANAKPEVEAPAEEPAEVAEESPVEETKPEETEPAEVETEIETKTTEEKPAEDVAEDPGEVTYITDYTSISDYMGSLLDSDKPAIVIYNEEEGYIINMQEGQYYQLKSSDKLLYNFNEMAEGWSWSLPNDMIKHDTYYEIVLEHSKIQPKQEVFLKKQLDNGELVKITCYFDPPAE